MSDTVGSGIALVIGGISGTALIITMAIGFVKAIIFLSHNKIKWNKFGKLVY
jgi:hypothetical protein